MPLHSLTIFRCFLDSAANSSLTTGAEPQRHPFSYLQHPGFHQGQSGVRQFREASVGYSSHKADTVIFGHEQCFEPKTGLLFNPSLLQVTQFNSVYHKAMLIHEFLQLNGPEVYMLTATLFLGTSLDSRVSSRGTYTLGAPEPPASFNRRSGVRTNVETPVLSS